MSDTPSNDDGSNQSSSIYRTSSYVCFDRGFAVAFLQASSVYYLTAILLHYVVPRALPVSSVQKGARKQGQVCREATNCIGPLVVKAGMWTIVERMHASGYSLLYGGSMLTSVWHVPYMMLVVVALDYLHDTWFYWTHRLLHTKALFSSVHRMHHESRVPTAFTGYSFHVVEAVIVFANEVIVCFLFPIHVRLHRFYHMYTTVIHNGGHAGYEIAPYIPSAEGLAFWAWRTLLMTLGAASRVSVSKGLNTVAHHDMHHRYPNVHFSLYMTHWDRLMGTEHPSYAAYVDSIDSKQF